MAKISASISAPRTAASPSSKAWRLRACSPTATGSRTTPSIVAFTEDGDRLVGQIAKRQAITNPENTVFAVKRLIGRKFESPDVQSARQLLPYTVVDAPNGDVQVRDPRAGAVARGDLGHPPARAQGFAEEALGEEAEERSSPCPPTSTTRSARRPRTPADRRPRGAAHHQRAHRRGARLRPRPRRGSVNIAVYDLGGGTFDISILELSDGIFEVRATAGDTYLGGEDFDQRIMDWLIGDFERETGIDLRGDRMALQRLKEAAERAKCELSTRRRGDDQPAVHLAPTKGRATSRACSPASTSRPWSASWSSAPRSPASTRYARPASSPTRSTRCSWSAARPARPASCARSSRSSAGAQPRHQPRRGGGDRRRHPGRHPARRHQGPRAARRHAALARHRDPRRPVHQADRAQLDHPDQERRRSSPPWSTTRTRSRSTSCRASARSPPRTARWAASSWSGFRRRRAACRRSRSRSRSTRTASSPCRRRDMATNQSQTIQINPAGGLSKEEIERLVRGGRRARHAGPARSARCGGCENRLEGLIYTNERVFEQFARLRCPRTTRSASARRFRKARVALISDRSARTWRPRIFDLNSVSRTLSELMLRSTKD